jgi:hypothetical protein
VVKRIPKNTSNKMDLKNLMLYIVVPVSMMGIMIAIAYLNIDFASMGIGKVLLIFTKEELLLHLWMVSADSIVIRMMTEIINIGYVKIMG